MEEHHRRRPTTLNTNLIISDQELEMYDIFTPDEEFFTPLTAATTTTTTTQSTSSVNEYQSITLKVHNKARERILPIFPSRSTLKSMVKQSITTTTVVSTIHHDYSIHSNEEVDFLLCNVPKQLLTLEQYQRRQMNIYIPSFELRTWDKLKKQNITDSSYMVTFYNDLYLKLSQQWHIDLPILDCNLARLRQCEIKNGFQFSLNDLPLALEWFLQMDIDVFNLKTCSFRQGEPRLVIDQNGQQSYEGIFTISQQFLEGRYGLTPCNKNNCFCCKKQSLSIQFIPKQIHCFLNQYKAILNCPVTCKTSNIIYALTCPCGEKDYVAHTNLSFVHCLLYHRREIVRMIYEFLIGDINANLIELKQKSEEMKTNDNNWLYQHVVRCPVVMRLFLDRNPLYWCFVPVPKDRTLRNNAHVRQVPLLPTTAQTTTTTTLPLIRRSDNLAMRLAHNIPKPTSDYCFTLEQFNEQTSYFQYGKDRDPVNLQHVTFYNATIVAVLPDDCSDMVKKFIESLFVTHAECQLNKDGRLITQPFVYDYTSRSQWYRRLTCRLLPSST